MLVDNMPEIDVLPPLDGEDRQTTVEGMGFWDPIANKNPHLIKLHTPTLQIQLCKDRL